MGLIRFFVVFLLGIGAAFGAYATGAFHHFSPGSAQDWPWRSHPVVLRVSGDAPAGESHCQPRYAVDNHSSRRVLVLFTPANEDFGTHGASDVRRSASDSPGGSPGYYGSSGSEEPRGYYGTSETDTPPDGAAPPSESSLTPRVRARTAVPIDVAPGEEKDVGPLDGRGMNSAIGRSTALTGARCGDDRRVTVQLSDCTTDETGVCSTASTFSSGGEYDSY